MEIRTVEGIGEPQGMRLSIDGDMKYNCADSYWLKSSSSDSINASRYLIRFKHLEFRETRLVCKGILKATCIKEYY